MTRGWECFLVPPTAESNPAPWQWASGGGRGRRARLAMGVKVRVGLQDWQAGGGCLEGHVRLARACVRPAKGGLGAGGRRVSADHNVYKAGKY